MLIVKGENDPMFFYTNYRDTDSETYQPQEPPNACILSIFFLLVILLAFLQGCQPCPA